MTNFNSNSSSNSDKSDSCKKSNSNNSNKSNIIKKGKIYTNPRKKYYNKFNSSNENSTNDNTVILTLKIKIAKNDFRFFNLKKYDDLFISLEKFFDLNKIDQSLVKPIVNKIFAALNKIFWLLNNKVGNYDKKYLNSLYNLWKKNDETLPKRKKSKEKSNNTSTISSSDSNDDINKNKKLTSNSFQDMNNLSEDEKDEKQKTSKSILNTDMSDTLIATLPYVKEYNEGYIQTIKSLSEKELNKDLDELIDITRSIEGQLIYYKKVKDMFNQDYVEEFFDKKVINNLLEEHYLNKKNNGRKIYNIYIFLIWYKKFFVEM